MDFLAESHHCSVYRTFIWDDEPDENFARWSEEKAEFEENLLFREYISLDEMYSESYCYKYSSDKEIPQTILRVKATDDVVEEYYIENVAKKKDDMIYAAILPKIG